MTCDLQYLQSSNNKNTNNTTTGPAHSGTGPIHITRKLCILIHIARCYDVGVKRYSPKTFYKSEFSFNSLQIF